MGASWSKKFVVASSGMAWKDYVPLRRNLRGCQPESNEKLVVSLRFDSCVPRILDKQSLGGGDAMGVMQGLGSLGNSSASERAVLGRTTTADTQLHHAVSREPTTVPEQQACKLFQHPYAIWGSRKRRKRFLDRGDI